MHSVSPDCTIKKDGTSMQSSEAIDRAAAMSSERH